VLLLVRAVRVQGTSGDGAMGNLCHDVVSALQATGFDGFPRTGFTSQSAGYGSPKLDWRRAYLVVSGTWSVDRSLMHMLIPPIELKRFWTLSEPG
jgi:hypothetical protein